MSYINLSIIAVSILYIYVLRKYLLKTDPNYVAAKMPIKRYYHKDNRATYTIIADFGDELCLLREDINVRILFKRESFEKFLKEIV